MYNALHKRYEDINSMMLLPVLLHPKSNGTVRLHSADPVDPPLIDPRYLSASEDVNVLLEGRLYNS